MAVIRINKTKNYTVMSNHHLRDFRLSLKAKGLLSQMLSLPDNWDYSVDGLIRLNRESRNAIQNMLKELESARYLVRTRTQDEKGQFGYIYDVYENPQEQTPRTENPPTDNPCTENQHQLNTNILSTDKQITERESVGTAKAAPTRPQKAKGIEEESPEAYRLAELLKARILKNKPTRKLEKNCLDNWARDIDRLHRLDGAEWSRIEKVLEWSQQDEFWWSNILSGAKLRSKFDTLEDQMERSTRNAVEVYDLG